MSTVRPYRLAATRPGVEVIFEQPPCKTRFLPLPQLSPTALAARIHVAQVTPPRVWAQILAKAANSQLHGDDLAIRAL